MLSPEMPVGVQSDGFVPIVQNSRIRFTWLAARLRLPSQSRC